VAVAEEDSTPTASAEEGAPKESQVSATTGVGANQREPGWYPTGTNPNEQSYWDGGRWIKIRNWVAGKGWVEADGHGALIRAQVAAAQPRLSANPYAEASYARPRTTAPATFSMGVFLLLVSGIALMFGSVSVWVHVSGSVGIASFHASVIGTDPTISTLIGVNGWITFIAGIVLVVFGGLSLSSEEVLLVGLTFVVSVATVVFASYDMFRIVQKISDVTTGPSANLSVGWGLICVLSAAVLALIISIARLLNSR
jgi:hypothetical protein